MLCVWATSPPPGVQPLGSLGYSCAWGESSVRRVILHGKVMDPAGFRSFKPTEAPHTASTWRHEESVWHNPTCLPLLLKQNMDCSSISMRVHRHWVPLSPVREERLFSYGNHNCIYLSLNQHGNTTDMMPCGRHMKGPTANTLNLPSNFTCSNCFYAILLDLEEKLPFTLDKDVC